MQIILQTKMEMESLSKVRLHGIIRKASGTHRAAAYLTSARVAFTHICFPPEKCFSTQAGLIHISTTGPTTRSRLPNCRYLTVILPGQEHWAPFATVTV